MAKQKKLSKRILSITLSMVLTAAGLMLPQKQVNAEEANNVATMTTKTISGLGTDIIADPTVPTSSRDEWKGSYVYFGTYDSNPVKYRVLDSETTIFGGTTMLLDCDSVLWKGSEISSIFDADSNIWADSDIRTYLNGTFLTNNFSKVEQSAIAESTVTSYELTTDSADGVNVADWTKNAFGNYVALDRDKVFLLDAEDVSNGAYGYSQTDGGVTNRIKKDAGGNAAYWWLRSAITNYSFIAGYVYSDGSISLSDVISDSVGVSPALNVNLSSVLFTSLISGNKGETGAEYKLTVLDKGKTIKVTDNKVVYKASNGTITVPYTYTDTAITDAEKVNQISVVITDKAYTEADAEILYYGALQNTDLSNKTGIGTFALPSSLIGKTLGTDYHIYILAEHINSTNATDYASEPVEITDEQVVKDKLISITAPKSITVKNGTKYADMKLPTMVNIVTEQKTVSTAKVVWNTSKPLSGKYKPSVKTKQTVTLKGTVTIPNTIYTSGVSLTTSIKITISAVTLPVGKKLVSDNGKAIYKITKSHLTKGTVTYIAPKNKKQSKITIPNTVVIKGVKYKVTAIANKAFKNNKNLKSVTIGKNINKIGKQAFYGCKKLKTVKIKSTKLKANKIGKKVFAKTSKSMTVKVPKKKYKAYKSMFIKSGVNKKAKFKKN